MMVSVGWSCACSIFSSFRVNWNGEIHFGEHFDGKKKVLIKYYYSNRKMLTEIEDQAINEIQANDVPVVFMTREKSLVLALTTVTTLPCNPVECLGSTLNSKCRKMGRRSYLPAWMRPTLKSWFYGMETVRNVWSCGLQTSGRFIKWQPRPKRRDDELIYITTVFI